MRWIIEGADQKTGRELCIVIEARDPQEAEERALYNDILIASAARPVLPPALEYSAPEPAPEAQTRESPVPFYEEVLTGARWLAGLAMCLRIVGCLLGILAAGASAIAVIGPVREWMPFAIDPRLWLAGAGLMLAIVFTCLLCGVMLRMTGVLALAVRDIARNTAQAVEPRDEREKRAALPATADQGSYSLKRVTSRVCEPQVELPQRIGC